MHVDISVFYHPVNKQFSKTHKTKKKIDESRQNGSSFIIIKNEKKKTMISSQFGNRKTNKQQNYIDTISNREVGGKMIILAYLKKKKK